MKIVNYLSIASLAMFGAALSTAPVDAGSVSSLSGSDLVIKSDNVDTSVTVTQEGSTIFVKDLGKSGTRAFAASAVRSITFEGGAGNDRFVNEVGNLPIKAYGRGGDDFLSGGARNDIMYGGDGNDWLDGGPGADKLYGDADDDTLVAVDAAFSDHAEGGAGFDSVWQDVPKQRPAPKKLPPATHGGLVHIKGVPVMWDSDTSSAERVRSIKARSGGVQLTIEDGMKQEDAFSCGPNSLARFLRYYGYDHVTYKKLHGISNALTGTLTEIMFRVARSYKSDVKLEHVNTSLDRVIDLLEENKPVIALISVERGSAFYIGDYPNLHWILLSGFDPRTLTISYMETTGESQSMSYAEFEDKWDWTDDTGHLTSQVFRDSLGFRTRTIIAASQAAGTASTGANANASPATRPATIAIVVPTQNVTNPPVVTAPATVARPPIGNAKQVLIGKTLLVR